MLPKSSYEDIINESVRKSVNESLKPINMYLIEWDKYCETKIHDHNSDGCIYKILEGNIDEYVYSDLLGENLLNKQTYYKNSIKYIDNNIGYHNIINNNNFRSYSLHIYTE